ncbi:MAG: 2-amino-4-hydroxy-6-hydroxymethyldihydropteridine diphosphokinase [Muribaculaceae bacterium]|nr:2-amino-4-hydroxy-6-hydroxymethyldihydropteridine diphosphokinase [Muribaculaceae bacterium]
MKYYLNLGSNLGNKLLHLTRAIKAIGEEFGPFETSHMVESDPWGFNSTNRFVNIAMSIESEKDPEEVLAILQSIEKSISKRGHRRWDGSYNDREIDIDIMASDGEEFISPILRIPHRHLASRDFFLRPFAEIAPDWRHPKTGLSASQMLEKLERTNSK